MTLVVFILGFLGLIVVSETLTQYHKRQMAKQQHFKDTIYAQV